MCTVVYGNHTLYYKCKYKCKKNQFCSCYNQYVVITALTVALEMHSSELLRRLLKKDSLGNIFSENSAV